MGCGSSTISTTHKENTSKKLLKATTEGMQKIKNKNFNSSEKAYLKVAEEARSKPEVTFENLILDSSTYFDLINNLKQNTNLRSFTMRKIDFEDDIDVLLHLYHSLHNKPHFESLELTSLPCLGNKKGLSIVKLAEAISLHKIILQELDFTDDDAEFLGLLLRKHSPRLKVFQLSGIFFYENIYKIIGGLDYNNTITELTITKGNISPQNFRDLVKAITSNECLRKLDVSQNPIGKGVDCFVTFTLPHLEILHLNNCDIDDDAFSRLADGLKTNETIKEIGLNNNSITNLAQTDFKNFFQTNKTIMSIYILHNPIRRKELYDFLSNDHYSKVIGEM